MEESHNSKLMAQVAMLAAAIALVLSAMHIGRDRLHMWETFLDVAGPAGLLSLSAAMALTRPRSWTYTVLVYLSIVLCGLTLVGEMYRSALR